MYSGHVAAHSFKQLVQRTPKMLVDNQIWVKYTLRLIFKADISYPTAVYCIYVVVGACGQ